MIQGWLWVIQVQLFLCAIPDWVVLAQPLGILTYFFIIDNKKQHQLLILVAHFVLLCRHCQ